MVRVPWNRDGSSARRRELPGNWESVRRVVLERDNHTCVRCGAPANQVDHIDNEHARDSADPRDLQSLCWPCHLAKTGRESAAVRRAQAAKLRHPEERPPGLR